MLFVEKNAFFFPGALTDSECRSYLYHLQIQVEEPDTLTYSHRQIQCEPLTDALKEKVFATQCYSIIPF